MENEQKAILPVSEWSSGTETLTITLEKSWSAWVAQFPLTCSIIEWLREIVKELNKISVTRSVIFFLLWFIGCKFNKKKLKTILRIRCNN